MSWLKIKNELQSSSKKEVINLLGKLYGLHNENKAFLESLFNSESEMMILKKYKSLLLEYLNPEPPARINLREARNTVNRFKKTSSIKNNIIDIMIYYVELGVDYSNKYGDMYEGFYGSLESMFDSILALLKTNSDANNYFLPRLSCLVLSSKNLGYGFYDYLDDSLTDHKKFYDI